MSLELYFELFNVLNRQGETAVNTQYTGTDVNPIVGGTRESLELPQDLRLHGNPRSDVGRSRPGVAQLELREPQARQAPLSARLGVTLAF